MLAHPPKPISRIAKIQFAPVHEPVEITAIGRVNALTDLVRRRQVIMPQQRE